MTTRVEPEIVRAAAARHRGPPRRRRRARPRAATSTDMEHKLPIGLGRDGEPLYVNLDFLDGTRGAHVNIRGISGVATKTSYATFLLYTLFHSGVLGAEAANTKALDLQRQGRGPAVPRPRRTSGSTTSDRERYRALGLPAGPFAQRRRLRPARARATRTPGPTSPPARTGVARLLLDDRGVLRRASCCRSCSPTPRTSASSTRWWSTTSLRKLKRDGEPVGDDGAWQIDGVDGAHLPRPRRPRSSTGVTDDDDGARLGRAAPSARARSTRSSAGCCRRSARSATSIRADIARRADRHDRTVRRAGHRRRPPQPRTTAPSGSSSASRCSRRSRTRRSRGAPPAAAVRRARRAEQVRAPRGRARSRRSCSTSPSAAAASA